jgi:hypothetical protein
MLRTPSPFLNIMAAPAPPNPQKLSRILHVLTSRNDKRTLQAFTIRNLTRLNKLVRAADTCHVKELIVMRDWLSTKLLKDDDISIVGVEYDFDDGARLQGRGDALLYKPLNGSEEKGTLIIVECKRIGHCVSEPVKIKRRTHAIQQALGYACRLNSWLQHVQLVEGLSSTAGTPLPFKEVMGATLLEGDEGNMEFQVVGRYIL